MGAAHSTATPRKSWAQRAQEAAAATGRAAQALPGALQSAAGTVAATGQAADQLVGATGQAAAGLAGAAQGAYSQNRGVYELVLAHTAGTVGGGVLGAGYFGGDATDDPAKALKEYRLSAAAASKDRIVRGLARALRRAGIDVDEDAPAEEIARTLQAKLPNPKNQKTFKADAEAQEKVCRTIADVLNDEFTPGAREAGRLIDTSLGAVSVCRQVAELVHSLAAGLHTEFLEVHASLTRVLRNLEVLDAVLAELHAKIVDRLGADAEQEQVASFQEVYRRAQLERERQMALLRNFLSVTLAPAKEELALAMREESESHDIIQRLELVPGTGDFADSLAMAVSGLGTVAAITARVDAALRKVGLSVENYLSSRDMEDLETALDAKLMSGGVSSDDVGKFLRAVQTLKANFYRRSELDFGGPAAAEMAAEIAGAYEGGAAKSTLDKRVAARKSERKLIVKVFIDKSTRQYDALLKAIQELGPHLGKEVPMSDKLEALRNALARLGQSRLGALNLELALIGFYADAAAREKKETFLAGLRVVQGVLDDLMGLEMYRGSSSQYFAAMHAAIGGLLRVIDFYSDTVAKKYGAAQPDEVRGGQPEELSDLPEVARSSYDLKRAINTFLYFFYVAKVRANLRQTHKELEFYGEKYQDILGDAVAARLRQLEAEKGQSLAGLGVKARELKESEFACKAGLYRALQGLDLYMKAFTDGIVAHPDDVKDVKRMLDGVQVIGPWFTENTGDDLAAAFDMMPGWDGAERQDADIAGVGGHYYERVAASTEHEGLFTPGVPQLATSVDRADALKRQVAKVYESFQALKNITNAFARIGSKFGGKELRRQAFMSPTQIYRALLEYLKGSALSMGGGLGIGTAPPTADLLDLAKGQLVVPVTVALRDGAGHVRPVPAVAAGQAPETAVYFGSTGLDSRLDGNFAVEDRYFTFCVKAMAAKVLTVIGVFDLFERPSPVYELTPTRMIIGGAGYDTIPEVIPEASELYFRLPRLVEFYKDLFAFKERGRAAQISMLPEMEGVFSGVIRLIFQRAEGGAAATGDYSNLEVRTMVQEINAIYENFRGAGEGSAISAALSSFVIEINRRYGLVKKSEWDTLQKLLSESRRGSTQGELNRTNYAILPGEDEVQPDRRAPSDRFLGLGTAAAAKLPGGEFAIDDRSWEQWAMLKDFREKLDGLFEQVQPDEFTTYSFSTIIRQGALEMRRAEGAANKIAVAARLIQGSGSLAGIDVGKAFMFHETVVVGLNLLNAVHTLLDRFRQRVIDTDVVRLRKIISDALVGMLSLPVDQRVVNPDAFRDLLAAEGDFTEGAAGPAGAVLGVPTSFQGRAGAGSGIGDMYVLLYGAAQSIIQTVADGAPSPEGLLETVSTYALDSQHLMGELLEVVTGLSATFQNLVQVRYPGTSTGQLHLDFSGLRDLVGGLMRDVRFYLDMFRPHIAKSVIAKYEDARNPGSLYWLEDRLLDKLVRGLPDDATVPEAERTKTLEWVSRTVNRTYATLVGFNSRTLANMTVATINTLNLGGTPAENAQNVLTAVAPGAATPANYEQYGRLFAALTYYDATADGDSGLVDLATVNLATAGGINSLVSAQKPVGTPAVRQFPVAGTGGAAASRVDLWRAGAGLSRNRSLLVAFNQVLAAFVRVFYDATSGKIYRTLIDGFANGAFSRAVMTRGNSLPDLYDGATIGANLFGRRGDPTSGGILCQSLALVLQRLATDISPTTQISDHLVATLSEIPLYIRESYRANLPAFIKLFELIQKKGECYKQLMSQTAIQVGRPFGPQSLGAPAGAKIALGGGRYVSNAAPGPLSADGVASSVEPLNASPPGSGDMQLVLARVIDGVAAGCYSIANAGAEVLRELADEPLYLQTQESSIQEYKARYGKLPLMPFSSALTFLKPLLEVPGGDPRLMPVHSSGDESFKLMYGTRKLLGRPTASFGLADAPGIRANLEAFNGAAAGREKMDPARYEEFLARAAAALRFVVDTRNYRGVLAAASSRGAPLRTSVVKAARGGLAFVGIIDRGRDANAVYAARSGVTPQKALAVTESSYQDQVLKSIGDVVGGAGPVALGHDRRKEWVYNIIDMNIIPINVHALMRGIPLAPLYNYVYTFEQMVALMFGETVQRVEALGDDAGVEGGVRNTRQAMLKLLIAPYAPVPLATYGNSTATHRARGANGLVTRIFRGDDSLMMGRPKFLSDQVFNKALFGTLIDTPLQFDETGPPGAGRIAAPGIGISIPGVPANALRVGQVGPGTETWVDPNRMVRTSRQSRPQWPDGDPRTPRMMYGALTYIGQPDLGEQPDQDGPASTALKRVQLGANSIIKMVALETVGKARFDTRLVRNLFFITNVQRVMRLKLNQELTQYRNVLVSNHSVVNPGVTEYGSMPPSVRAEARDRRFGPGNETAGDRRYDSDVRMVQ